MRELSTRLEGRGWWCLHCKFDCVNPRPLSFIISAFDRYFTTLLDDSSNERVDTGGESTDELGVVRKRILELFANENMSTLCHLIPSVKRVVRQASDQDGGGREDLLAADSDAHGASFNLDYSDTEASKYRLHHLFGLLLRAISHKHVMLFLDDLHWGDQASLDLIMALVHQQANEDSRVLFVGSYRSNEVSGPLDASLREIESLTNVTLTEIPLNGLSCDNVNAMVSEALSYPQRLTRRLSRIIQQKSTGNPLFVKEFLNDLAAENLLNYR